MNSNTRLKMASSLLHRLRDAVSPPPPTDDSMSYKLKGLLGGAGVGGAGGAAYSHLFGPEMQAEAGRLGGVPTHSELEALRRLTGLAGSESMVGRAGSRMADEIPRLLQLAEDPATRLASRFATLPPGKLALLGAGAGALGLGSLGLGAGSVADLFRHRTKMSSRRPLCKAAAVMDQFMKHAIIKHDDGGYTLYSHAGKTLGKHPSKAKAIAQEQAIKAHGG